MSAAPDSAELQSIVSRIEPTARLVPARAMRRAIRLVHEREFMHPHAVHDRCWRVARDELFQLLTPAELGLSPSEPAPELLLIPALPAEPTAHAWARLWRSLFHAAVDQAFDSAVRSGRIGPAFVDNSLRALGPARRNAVRQVLEEENLVDEHDSDDRLVREFAAFALEVMHFSPDEWPTFFPGIRATEEPLRTIRAVVDSGQLFEKTRPPGLAAEPSASVRPQAPAAAPHADLSDSARARLLNRARRGNDVGTAIHLYRAGDTEYETFRNHLLGRLEALLQLTPAEVDQWAAVIRDILPRAAAGGWPVERRFLYELQRACLAVERPAYAADLFEWAVTLGRRPLKRPLPRTTWLDVTRRLRAAHRYAERLADSASASGELAQLAERAAQRAERKAREELRPEIVSVLDDVGLVPRNLPERLSREKLVDELLDTACDRGFLRIGDLRDAVARSRVKLPDLRGPRELVRGDPLILANQKLTERLDGVYRRGEIYMRLLQRGCSVFFGTRPGRAFTRFVALPFGGAYLLIEAVHHMVDAGAGLVHWLTGWHGTVNAVAAAGGGMAGTLTANPTLESGGVTWPSLIAVGVFLFLMLHWGAFRRGVARAAKFAFVKVPVAVRRSPIVRAVLDNYLTRFFRHYLLFPLTSGALAALGVALVTDDGAAIGLVGAGVALLSATFFRTPFGREAEDRLNEVVARIWRVISVNFVVGILTFILQVFRAVFEAIDRGIHAVDEWLRFREGDSRVRFAAKLLLGMVWAVVAYLFRFAWNLLVEPQINPIKHFPVVTVSHKLLLPLIPSLADQFQISNETMGTIVFGIPGIFGFLVWELKENWKLYRANASATMRPIVVGSHGEKVRALLRPGFHSGVVPKTYAKLRRATRSGRARRAARYRHTLEHVAEAVHRFAERDFVAYLGASRRWGGLPVRAGHVRLTPNRILLDFEMDGRAPAVVAIDELGGWIIAGIAEPGWLSEIGPGPRAAFEDALVGLYKRAGVHAVCEQSAHVFGDRAAGIDAVPEGLIVPLPDGSKQFFDYDDGPELSAQARRLPSDEMVFTRRPLSWNDWVERWEADAAGKPVTDPLIPGWRLLPVA